METETKKKTTCLE